MKIHDKIRYIRKNVLGLSLKEFHKKLRDIFGDEVPGYDNLCRIERGYRKNIRLRNLCMICTGLGVSLKELREGTEEEESKIVNIVRNTEKKENRYIYNEKAMAVILSPKDLKFLAMELVLLPLGITKEEEDPIDVNKFEKLIIVLQGKVAAHIGSEKHLVRKGDTLAFASNIPHRFENPSRNVKARCIIVQNPKSY